MKIFHLLAVMLSVAGVPFQQRDVGVSACATTALWASLKVSAAMEPLTLATPAQITTLASKYSLPFGRPMPSEGLSNAQMCQAVQALGASPSLLRVDDFDDARGYRHCALRSGVAPVLILDRPGLGGHAVAAVDMITSQPKSFELDDFRGAIGDRAAALESLLVHDDRVGLYRASKIESGQRQMNLALTLHGKPDPWRVTHILIPAHQIIRISAAGLRNISISIAQAVYAAI